MAAQTLDYAQPRGAPFSLWRLFVWLTPVWCAGIVGLHWIFGGSDDPYWCASIGFAALVGTISVAQGRRGLALYCFGILLLVLAVALPSFSYAT